MKHKFLIFLAGSLIFFASITLNSCRENFGFKEFENLKTDSLHLSGTVALPLINTELTLEKYLPPNDSSLWAEVDATGLVHLKMYYEDLAVIKMSDIFDDTVFPMTQGTLVLKDSVIVQSDTSKMKIYDRMFSGKLHFSDPKVRFTIENDIPLATFFRLDTLLFYNIGGELLSNDEHITYEIDAPAVMGQTIGDTVLIDKNVMPILPLAFSPVPKYVGFKLSAGSHTNQMLPFDVTGNEEMHIDAEIDLPLDAKLETILMADTIPFDWNGETYSQIKEATLKMFFNNGFPVDGYIQIYFSDTTNVGGLGDNIDSIFSKPTEVEGFHLESAEADAAGSVTVETKSEASVTLSQERVQYLKERHASQIIIIGKLNTLNSDNGDFIRIEGSNKLGVRLGIMAKFEGDTNDIP